MPRTFGLILGGRSAALLRGARILWEGERTNAAP